MDLVEPDQFTHAAGRSGPRRRTSGVWTGRVHTKQPFVSSQLHEFGAGYSDPAWPPGDGLLAGGGRCGVPGLPGAPCPTRPRRLGPLLRPRPLRLTAPLRRLRRRSGPRRVPPLDLWALWSACALKTVASVPVRSSAVGSTIYWASIPLHKPLLPLLELLVVPLS